MKILVVDDSKAMRSIVRRALQQAGFGGHEVQEAGNGAEAFTTISAACPDVVLCDWNMPEMSGLQLLERLNTSGIKPKFGFVTSEGTDDIRQLATAAGALFFICKPFTPEKLREALAPHLGQP